MTPFLTEQVDGEPSRGDLTDEGRVLDVADRDHDSDDSEQRRKQAQREAWLPESSECSAVINDGKLPRTTGMAGRTPASQDATPHHQLHHRRQLPLILQLRPQHRPSHVLMPRQIASSTPSLSQFPTEILHLITNSLSRRDIKCLRLVCRQIEAKVSSNYFRNVVVPFKAELYALPYLGQDDPPVLDRGMHIFKSFGPYIFSFALSLEVDEDLLARPPIKPPQQAVPAFWGIYCWPHSNYRRYQDLEDIERTADEVRGMKEALSYLKGVKNLGLCCDAGLGFLYGADIRGRQAASRRSLFTTNEWRRILPVTNEPNTALVSATTTRGAARVALQKCRNMRAERETLMQMLADAGYTSSLEVDKAFDYMVKIEKQSLLDTKLDALCQMAKNNPQEDQDKDRDTIFTTPVNPSNLTVAQMEMLLELDWAHRAMIQSYAIGIIDNASAGCFVNLTSFTIAKIPSSHLQILCRDDLWCSIPTLKNVSLGVIPDKRKISAKSFDSIDSRGIPAADAVSITFQLLCCHIGTRSNIESVHFEWACGGELTPGLPHRNLHVLPAPFVSCPERLTLQRFSVHHADQLLTLPFVKRLSLKNCWLPPHAFLYTIRNMALSSLEELKLETFSITGPPTVDQQPSFVRMLLHQRLEDVGQDDGDMPDSLHPWMLNHDHNNPVIERADLTSWPGILTHFLYGTPLDFDPLAHLPDHVRFDAMQNDYKLRSLSLKSCGYVAIDCPHIDTVAIMMPTRRILPSLEGLSKSAREALSPLMQSMVSGLNGIVVPWMRPYEKLGLADIFDVKWGWKGIYDEQDILDAVADGVVKPGNGRFTGQIHVEVRS
ncbi:hypothetical protein HIM_04846 [Hirsutella minnesotensis 3608]|uniref:F-box domain-containing protein n=1 Tax=Hirsutella minnesotensis 3608 TaxID=1043627 RepID=A0A0F8A5P5_9HYPO|nr:hypothetical protein HIM_04846 [Hirsutella minnesotensis 3608]